MDRVNVLIIGGGVVGCALAHELSARIEDVFLVEQSPRLGMATSTRNSGVIHSGIYYPPSFLKARLCVEGNRLTKEFCAEHDVPHNNCGKIVVASDESGIPELEKLAENGRMNGVEGLQLVGRERIRQREPHIQAAAALEVPSTAIVSAEELVKTFARVAVDRGAHILTNARVVHVEARPDCIAVEIELGDPADRQGLAKEIVEAHCVINSAGLYADEVAAMLGNHSFRIYPVRGEYAEVVRTRANLVNALVYPLPHHDRLSLGVHLTKTLWGTVLVGPTARYVTEKNDYERDRLPVEEFLRDAQGLLPELRLEDLRLAYSGLRPKLVPPAGKGMADFVIARDPNHPRAIHLVGIESPGLTSAPAIARYVASLVSETLD
ncbi:MAG TPA: NAD(P)/FAD-dependent oxidoreductase [Terriglobales bacterium]|nr:NAD(P)/FAD-dependent oxidoreductase [Terriglobales bacterium]